MQVFTAPVDPTSARRALRLEVERLAGLLRSVRHPTAPALGAWTVAEVATHLSQAWTVVPALATRDPCRAHQVLPNAEETEDGSALKSIWQLGGVTTEGVRADPERDLAVLANRIIRQANAYLLALDTRPSTEPRPWLVEGVEVSEVTFTCHLLNETMVHGYDIARADRQRWPLDPSHAALVFDGFLVPIIQALDARALVDQARGAGRELTYELRIRGGARYIFEFHDGALLVERSRGDRKVDCHLSADPAALLLVAWGRRSQWDAIVRGQLVAWGRKPWLGPKLRGLIRNP